LTLQYLMKVANLDLANSARTLGTCTRAACILTIKRSVFENRIQLNVNIDGKFVNHKNCIEYYLNFFWYIFHTWYVHIPDFLKIQNVSTSGYLC
jgi:hypothetical protein